MQIEMTFDRDFERCINHLEDEYGVAFTELNSLSNRYLGLSTFIDNFIDTKTVADASADGSSNVTHKDIVTLRSEMSKPHEKMLAYNKIFYEMKKKYGLNRAKEWLKLQWSYGLYLHDANTSTFIPYCFAYDLKSIAEKGLFYLNDHKLPEPPKHLDTFITFVKEFINFASNRSAGAVGLPNLIPYMFYFWKKDCENGVHGLQVTNPEQYAKSQIQNFIYAINQPYTRDGIQSAFTNTSIFDHEYLEALFGSMEFPDGTFAIDYEEEIIQFEKWFLEEMKAIKDGGRMFTFPVNTISLLRQNGKFVDEEFAHWASNHNRVWNDSNFFCDSSVNSLSNCCRLKSDITDLYFNSIGGSALKVGSVKVSTVNLARIAYETKTEQEYLDVLKKRLIINLEALDCVRHIIKRNVEKGLLPNFMDGIMDFEHLYNTVGINGVYETMKTFGYTYKDEFGNTFYKEEAFNFGKKIFELCHDTIKEFTADKDYKGNIEQVPSMCGHAIA